MLVSVAGRAEPIELGFVETRRGDDESWIRFQVSGRDKRAADDAPFPPDTAWIHVPESCILGVEVSFRRTAHPSRARLGFGYTESDE